MTGLKDAHRAAIIATLAANDRVERAVLFGSRATGTNTVSSDVDIALFGDRLTLTDQARLAAALDEIPMAQSVDLLLYDSIRDEMLRAHIRNHGVRWYARRTNGLSVPPNSTDSHDHEIDSWQAIPLDRLVEDIIDRRGVTPLKLGSEFTTTGHRVISAKLVEKNRVNLSAAEPRFVDADTYRKWMRTPLKEDDVILTSEAPLGKAAYLTHGVDWCLGQRLFGIRTSKDRLYGRFLFYALQSDGVQHAILARASGTTAQDIRQAELRQVVFV